MKDPKRKQKRMRPLVWFLLAVFAVLLIGTAVFLHVMKVQTVTVKGDVYADEDVVISRLFLSEDDYRLGRVLLRQWAGESSTEAFASVKIYLTGISSAEIEVTETEAVARIPTGDSYFYLNREGILLTDRPGEFINIRGITVLSAELLKPVEVNDPAGLSRAIEIVSALKEESVKPADLLYDSGEGTFSFRVKGVLVLLGTAENIREKITAFGSVFPEIQGFTGTLHLERVESEKDRNRIVFEPESKE